MRELFSNDGCILHIENGGMCDPCKECESVCWDCETSSCHEQCDWDMCFHSCPYPCENCKDYIGDE